MCEANKALQTWVYCVCFASQNAILSQPSADSSFPLELAGEDELIYAYYDEDMNAEFIFIQNGLCMRAYQEYDGEVVDRNGRVAEIFLRNPERLLL